MLRVISTLSLLLVAAACRGPAEEPAETDEPVVGRLQFQDRIVDLTMSAFSDAPDSVPKSSVAVIMADVEVEKPDSDTHAPKR
ncbi:MAG TPA: hypothetical protein VJR89_25505 [Polyangiales bacterium]|nr:hypothetical protein [Polyangiales bacterium]